MPSEIRNCQNCKTDFAIEPEDFDFYAKVKVPPPTFCPDCRLQRRMVWRNEHFLFKKKDIFGKMIFSGYAPDSQILICDNDHWWSDERDATEQGKAYDFSRPFFEQFKELLYSVAIPAHINSRSVASEYTNNVGDLKNCYLCFNANDAENCSYGIQFNRMRNSLNFTTCSTSDECADIFNVTDSYRTFSSADSADCVDVRYCFDCRNCQNCVGCVGLRHKSYCIDNVQYTKEEYQKRISETDFGSYSTHVALLEKMRALSLQSPRKYMHTMKCQDVSGEYIYGSKNVHDSYLCFKAEDMRYCQDIHNASGGYDCLVALRGSGGLYENAVCGLEMSEVKFSFECHPSCFDVSYSIFCSSSSHLFGCVGLRKKEYCILNVQYTKEEYEALLPKIIEQMKALPFIDTNGHSYTYGEFFPPELSPFAYNETIAQEYFPLSPGTAAEKNYPWREPDVRSYVPTVSADSIPDSINDIPDTYTEQLIECGHREQCSHNCSKAFKVIPSELAFYKRMKLPLPRACPNCRHYERLYYRNGFKLWSRSCMCEKDGHGHAGKCPNNFETSYAPERTEIVYCEGCYQREIS